MFVLRCREERIAQLSFFFLRRSFFAVRAGLADPESACSDTANPNRLNLDPASRWRMRWSGRIFWLLAYHPAPAGRTFFPPSPPNAFGDWPWEVVSSYSSATAPGLHGISRADPLFQARKELLSGLAACGRGLKIYFELVWAGPPQIAGRAQRSSSPPSALLPARPKPGESHRVSPPQRSRPKGSENNRARPP